MLIDKITDALDNDDIMNGKFLGFKKELNIKSIMKLKSIMKKCNIRK